MTPQEVFEKIKTTGIDVIDFDTDDGFDERAATVITASLYIVVTAAIGIAGPGRFSGDTVDVACDYVVERLRIELVNAIDAAEDRLAGIDDENCDR